MSLPADNPSPTSTPQATVMEQILGSLTPFFLDGADGDPNAARAAARYMLDGYQTETTEELQIAAQIIACGFAALDGLRRATVDKGLTVTTQLRLRGSATAMNRAVQQGRHALDRHRKGHAAPPPAVASPGQSLLSADFQAALRKASDALAFARSDFARSDLTGSDLTGSDLTGSGLDTPGKPPTYWQERRAVAREARLADRYAAAMGRASAQASAVVNG